MVSGDLIDTLIRAGLIAALAVLCFQIFSPFLGLMVWGLILAITIYPLHQRLARSFGGKQGRASTVIVVAGVLVIGVPFVLLAESFAVQIFDVFKEYDAKTLTDSPAR